MGPLCAENSVEDTQSCIRIPVWLEMKLLTSVAYSSTVVQYVGKLCSLLLIVLRLFSYTRRAGTSYHVPVYAPECT